METTRVLVIGGNGYLGKEIVARLVKKGFLVTVFSRKSSRVDTKGIRLENGSALDKKKVKQLTGENDVVIHLAAVIRTIKKWKYKENIRSAQIIAEVMEQHPEKRLIYFSTQNVNLTKTGPYGNSKKRAEEIVIRSHANYMILRPNYVYGIDKENDFYQMARIMKRTGICPLLNHGNTRFQPLRKEDVAKVVVDCISNFRKGSILELSGEKTISIREAAALLRDNMGIRLVMLPIPLWALRLIWFATPFDVKGYDLDRVSRQPHFIKTKRNLDHDLKRIASLLR